MRPPFVDPTEFPLWESRNVRCVLFHIDDRLALQVRRGSVPVYTQAFPSAQAAGAAAAALWERFGDRWIELDSAPRARGAQTVELA